MIKLAIIAALAGFALGAICYLTIQDMDTLARGGALEPTGGVHGLNMMPQFGIALVSLFVAWIGLVGLHRFTGICGRALWLPLGLSALVAVVTSLILVAVEFHALPLATWKVLGIALPFMATGGILAVSMTKHRW